MLRYIPLDFARRKSPPALADADLAQFSPAHQQFILCERDAEPFTSLDPREQFQIVHSQHYKVNSSAWLDIYRKIKDYPSSGKSSFTG